MDRIQTQKQYNNVNYQGINKDNSWKLQPERNIYSNIPDIKIKKNSIHTSKYNYVNFIPKNLFQQFTKLPNIYFLIIGLLQMVPEITTSNGVPVTYMPLTFIVAVTMIKDFFEDYKKKKSDDEENNRQVLTLTSEGKFDLKKWKDLLVGDIIKVLENEYFSADIALLFSSEKKSATYIETKNLDGETNLKSKNGPLQMENLKSLSENQLYNYNLQLQYEGPNPYLYSFSGNIVYNQEKISLNNNNFVLRGCSLRNTEYAVGVICYTGHQTKIMLNSQKSVPKYSKLEKTMSQQLYLVFTVQILLCILCALIVIYLNQNFIIMTLKNTLFYIKQRYQNHIFNNLIILKQYQNQQIYLIFNQNCLFKQAAIWYSIRQDDLLFLKINQSQPRDNYFYYNFLVKIGGWLLIFQNFVPISLLVTLEMVKFVQGIFIQNDDSMISDEGIKVAVQSSNLNEELGQVQYVFSDKTGTLTCNIMEFKNLCVKGQAYGERRDLDKAQEDKLDVVTNVDFHDQKFFDNMQQKEIMQYLVQILFRNNIFDLFFDQA